MKTVLAGGTLIDGTGAAPLTDGAVAFEDGRITAAGQSDSLRPADDQRIVDVRGKTVLPGLIDCHIHMDLHGFADTFEENFVEDKLRTLRTAREMESTLRRGITTVRNVGSSNHIDFAVKEAIERGWCEGPNVLTCGRIISITTRGNDYFRGLYREADGADEVRKAAREQIKAGADFLKVMATGAVMNPGERPGATQFNREELRAAVEEADKLGLAVAAHAHGLEGIKNAILSGVRTVEHGTFMDEEAIELFLEHDVYLIPTYVVGHCIRNSGDQSKVAPFMRKKYDRLKHRFNEMLSLAIERGVSIAFGTDAGTPFNHHGNNALQLKLYVDDGFFSPLEAIRAATGTAARAIGREQEVGTLEPGKIADVLVVDGDLTRTVDALLDSVCMVYKDGRLVHAALPIEDPRFRSR